MMERRIDIRDVLRTTTVEGLDLLPANIDLSAAEVQLVGEVARESVLSRVLRPVIDEYDVILVDCQPSLGLLTVNALTAAHGVLIPLECEFFALRGVALLVETIEKVRDRLNPRLEIDGILATMYDSRTLHSREVIARVHEAFGDTLLQTVIGRTVKFPDASVAAEPITSYAHEPPGRRRVPPAGPRARRPWRRRLGRRRPASTRRLAPPTPLPLGDAEAVPVRRRRRRPGSRSTSTNFTGPFDLLLGLIAKHKLDITEVALGAGDGRVHRAHPRGGRAHRHVGPRRRRASSSSSRRPCSTSRRRGCCPRGEVEDAEDLELLEARDLLFARLLQYRAYKQVAAAIADRLATEGRRFPRTVQLEPHFAALLPELVWRIGPEQLAALAARALAPRPAPPGVDVSHLHAPGRVASASRPPSWSTGCGAAERRRSARWSPTRRRRGVVVVRFLALLELFREGAVAFDQVTRARRADRAVDRSRGGRRRDRRGLRRRRGRGLDGEGTT